MISELKLNWRCIMIFLLKWVKFYKICIFTPHIVVKILLWRRVSKFSLLWSWWMTEGLENWLVTSRHTTWKTCNIFHIVSADWDQNLFYMLIWGFDPSQHWLISKLAQTSKIRVIQKVFPSYVDVEHEFRGQ